MASSRSTSAPKNRYGYPARAAAIRARKLIRSALAKQERMVDALRQLRQKNRKFEKTYRTAAASPGTQTSTQSCDEITFAGKKYFVYNKMPEAGPVANAVQVLRTLVDDEANTAVELIHLRDAVNDRTAGSWKFQKLLFRKLKGLEGVGKVLDEPLEAKIRSHVTELVGNKVAELIKKIVQGLHDGSRAITHDFPDIVVDEIFNNPHARQRYLRERYHDDFQPILIDESNDEPILDTSGDYIFLSWEEGGVSVP